MRDYIFDWVRTLAAYFIFMTMALNFIPEGQYRKYIRYFFSLLLLLVLSRPLGRLTGWEEQMSRSLDELLDDLENQESQEAGLYVGEKNLQLMERACEEEIREQTEELLAEYGLELVTCVSQVELSEAAGIRSLHVRAKRAAGAQGISDGGLPDHNADVEQQIRERLMKNYELKESQVTVYVQ